MEKALLVLDMQNDFCPGGALSVEHGDEIVPIINRLSAKFDIVVATEDWHPSDHISFAENHGKKVYDIIDIEDIKQVLWPVHCVKGTYGAKLHKDLKTDNFNLILRKGTNPKIDSYSAFVENDKKTKTGLSGYLNSLGVKQVYITGLALDYCVFYSAVDAKKFGFDVYVIEDAAKGVNFPEDNIEKSINAMKELGIKIISSKDIL